MQELQARIFKLMQEIESDPEYAPKAFALGQILGKVLSGESVIWIILGFGGLTKEMLEDLCSEIELDYKKIIEEDNSFVIILF